MWPGAEVGPCGMDRSVVHGAEEFLCRMPQEKNDEQAAQIRVDFDADDRSELIFSDP
jgi:hypothetical protein